MRTFNLRLTPWNVLSSLLAASHKLHKLNTTIYEPLLKCPRVSLSCIAWNFCGTRLGLVRHICGKKNHTHTHIQLCGWLMERDRRGCYVIPKLALWFRQKVLRFPEGDTHVLLYIYGPQTWTCCLRLCDGFSFSGGGWFVGGIVEGRVECVWTLKAIWNSVLIRVKHWFFNTDVQYISYMWYVWWIILYIC